MENGRVHYVLKDEFLPGDMGATKAKEEEVKTPLEIRLDDDFGGDSSCILVWMVSIPKLWDAVFSGPWDGGAVYYVKVTVALGTWKRY
jgi:hypothetical protein